MPFCRYYWYISSYQWSSQPSYTVSAIRVVEVYTRCWSELGLSYIVREVIEGIERAAKAGFQALYIYVRVKHVGKASA